MSVSISEYNFTFFVSCVCVYFLFFFSQGGQLVGLVIPALGACHLIYVSSIVCIVFMLVGLFLSPSFPLSYLEYQSEKSHDTAHATIPFPDSTQFSCMGDAWD